MFGGDPLLQSGGNETFDELQWNVAWKVGTKVSLALTVHVGRSILQDFCCRSLKTVFWDSISVSRALEVFLQQYAL